MTLPPDHSRAGDQPPLGPIAKATEMPPILPTPNPRGEVQDTPDWRAEPAQSTQPPAQRNTNVPAAPTQPKLTTIMGNLRRSGRWQVPSKLTVRLGLSDAILDFREAEVASPIVELHVHGLMSAVKVVVPPEVEVVIAGGASLLSSEQSDVPSNASARYQIRVTTHSIMSTLQAEALPTGEKPSKGWWNHH